jgi:hypothetical protein
MLYNGGLALHRSSDIHSIYSIMWSILVFLKSILFIIKLITDHSNLKTAINKTFERKTNFKNDNSK